MPPSRPCVRALTVLLILVLCSSADAVAAAPLADGARRALVARVDSLLTAGHADASAALLARGLATARATGDGRLLVDLLVREAARELQRGEPRVVEPHLREAVATAEALGDSLRLCAAVRWLSVAVGMQGRVPEARRLYQRLLDTATAIGDRRFQGWALVGMGWDAWREGRADEACDDYRRAAAHFRETGERDGGIWAANGLGNALSRGGDFRGAAAAYARAAELAREAGFATVEIMALNNLGSLEYGLGDPGLAQARFGRALALARRTGNGREAVTPGVNLALCEADLGRFAAASATLDTIAADTERRGLRDLQAMVLCQQGSLLARRGRPAEAASVYRRCLAFGETAPGDVRVRALTGLSDALAAVDSAGAALAVVTAAAGSAATAAAGAMRAALELTTGRRLREAGRPREALPRLLAAAALGARLEDEALRLEALVEAARCDRALLQPDSALARLESAAVAWETGRGLPLDPEWRERRGASGQAVYTALGDLLLGPGVPDIASVARAFDRLQPFKARTLAERMSGPGRRRGEEAPASAAAVTLARLQREVLQPDEVLLDYSLGREVSFLFVVTRAGARAVRLPGEDDLGPRLRLYHGLLATPPVSAAAATAAEVAAAGASLARDLLGGAAPELAAASRVLIAPDGAVNLVPFAEWLPEQDVVRVPSATVLARVRARAPAADVHALRVLALAGGEDRQGRPLVGARREVRALGRRYRDVRGHLADSEDDSVAAATLAGAELLHVAAHLRSDDQRPWRSRFRFGGADTAAGLTAARVAELDLGAHVAFLSSCGSAGGNILSGEGVLGMTGAFLGAGAHAVVATLWPVDDAATTELVERFYAELSRGASVSTALRRAQRSLRARPATAHPFFWAGFVVAGDGAITAPLAPRRALPPWVWVGVPPAAAAAWALRVRRRRGVAASAARL